MKMLLITVLALGAITACAETAGIVHEAESHREAIREGHIDLLLLYHANAGLHMAVAVGEHDHDYNEHDSDQGDEGHGHEHMALDRVEIVGGPKAAREVPAGAAWNFIGGPGRYIFVLPQSEVNGLPFIGLNTEELNPELFASAPTLRLAEVHGPGHFFLYQVDAFGQPVLHINSAEPVRDNRITLPLGTHIHYNWGFSEPGEYALTFEIGATLAGGTPVTSDSQIVYFRTVGLPTYLHEGHVDIGLHHEADHGLQFYIKAEEAHEHGEHAQDHDHEHDHGTRLHPGDAILLLGAFTVAEVPVDPAYAFLGVPGSEVFLVRQQPAEGVPFLGWSAEALDPAVFTGAVHIELHAVEGPGNLYLYEADPFGAVNVIWSRGAPESAVLELPVGIHRHLNLAVTAAGTYELELHATGHLVSGGRAHARTVITLQAGGLEGYYGHFRRTVPHWITAETGGLLYTGAWPWLWSPELGWICAHGHGGPEHLYFRKADEAWLWTSPQAYPYYWLFESGSWNKRGN